MSGELSYADGISIVEAMTHPLSAEECDAAADCARNYPPGHGNELFYSHERINFSEAVDLLASHSPLLKYG